MFKKSLRCVYAFTHIWQPIKILNEVHILESYKLIFIDFTKHHLDPCH